MRTARRRTCSARRSTASSCRSPSACNTSRRLESEDDDDADFAGQRSSATAGWTVLCNDRAVIVGDKSRLTGWGDWHPALPPAVRHHHRHHRVPREARRRSCPVTTTKRALDTSSNVWLESLVKMKEGMRVWIEYTNQWKNQAGAEQQQARHWEDARPMSLSKAIEAVAQRKATKKSDDEGVEFNPRRTRFSRSPRTRRPPRDGSRSRNPPRKSVSWRRCCSTTRTRSPAIVGEKCVRSGARQGQEAGRLTHERRFFTAVQVAAKQGRRP